MVRGIVLLVIIIAAIVIWVLKATAGAITDSEELKQETLKSQTQKTMHAAAAGVNWLNQQWEEATQAAAKQSGEPPYIALVVIVEAQERDGIDRARQYCEKLGQSMNAMTRIDVEHGHSEKQLVRLSIDTRGWPTAATSIAADKLHRCLLDLEEVGRAAFTIRHENGRNELLAKNSLC